MFAFIRGELIQATPSHLVVETSGIGYLIYIPANLFGRLPQIGQTVLLHTAYVVRELSHTLYGFLVMQERDLFEILMMVTGIGPKLALSIIGHLTPNELQRAVSDHQIITLSKVPGIGKKTAERLIIELRDKLADLCFPDPSGHAIQLPSDPKAQKIRDAMGALINLGYNQLIAQKAIKKTLGELSDEVDLATLITTSLKNV